MGCSPGEVANLGGVANDMGPTPSRYVLYSRVMSRMDPRGLSNAFFHNRQLDKRPLHEAPHEALCICRWLPSYCLWSSNHHDDAMVSW